MGEYRYRLKNSRFQMICQVFQNFFADFLYPRRKTGILPCNNKLKPRAVKKVRRSYYQGTTSAPYHHSYGKDPSGHSNSENDL